MLGRMRLHRFFIHRLSGESAGEPIGQKREVTLSDPSLIHQLKDVFRLHPGDMAILLDNSGFEYVTEIVSADKKEMTFRVTEARAVPEPSALHTVLYQAVPKKDIFEWILEKGTELGVSGFVPVLSERCEKKAINVERCERILVEASEQSGRGTVPTLGEMISLESALKENHTSFIAFHPTGEKWDAKKFIVTVVKNGQSKIGLLIGPEGGWTDAELTLFQARKIPIFSFGAQILRAETAAIVAAASLLL